nr:MAG TPA: hypothetical protein [Caudoviricetes sp.]
MYFRELITYPYLRVGGYLIFSQIDITLVRLHRNLFTTCSTDED